MTGQVAPVTAASVERLVDAVLMAETADALPTTANMVSTIGEAYGDFFGEMGARTARAINEAADGRIALTVEEVVHATSDVVCGLVVNELTVTAAIVLLLAQSLAKRSDVDTGVVMREVLESFQRGVSDG